MLFLNPWLLIALAGVAIPVIVHLVRRQAAKPVDWGAMRFLIDAVSERRRRMEWEDWLLMAARCLLLALAALAVARPFVPPDSPTPWTLVLPTVLLGTGLFGGSFVFSLAWKRWLARAGALVLIAAAAGMVMMERRLHLRRFESSGARDVVLILDASTSMSRGIGPRNLFDEALDDARRIVKQAPRGTSFAVIVGGPSPQALSTTPVSHRADVLAQLQDLRVVGGTFRAHEALSLATIILAEGQRPNKDILVLGDGQRHGWRLDQAGAWQALAAAWETLPAKPRLLLRTFPQAPSLANAGIAAIDTARDLTGTDRPCLLRTRVVNTGNQPVMPGELVITAGDAPIAKEPLGMLVPGQSQVIETRHQFTRPGPQVITARLSGRDDLAGDDRGDHVVFVRKSLRVLVADGNPGGRFLDRAAGHTALALAPVEAIIRGGHAGAAFLMDPTVVAAADLTPTAVAGADVVVLADVTRLPAPTAAALADHTAAGAGLIILAGPRADPAFYNAWEGVDGPVSPASLGPEAVSATGVSPAPATFRHEALAWAADAKNSDLGAAVVRRWRKATVAADSTAALAGAFANGDPFLVTRGYGRGRCALATCAFDSRAGNLPGRTSFVPLVHELVAWAAAAASRWNIDPASSPSLLLDSRASGGLTARYSRLRNPNAPPLLERVDPAIDFNWGSESPAPKIPSDNFTVLWQASLLPQVTGFYQFDAEADDQLTVTIGNRQVLTAQANQPGSGRIRLEAGSPVPIGAVYQETGGLAVARLFWTPPGGARQIVPSAVFLPATKDQPDYAATDPLGRPRKASISLGRRGRELRVEGPAVPGLYQVNLPADVAGPITGVEGSTSVPWVVRRDINESRLETLDERDLAQLRARTDVIQPASAQDVLAVLSGRGFGREITRVLTLAAVVLLVLETALARWVSRTRRVGDDLRVDFGDALESIPPKGGRR